MDNINLKKLQKTEFDILCFINDFCEKHEIKYSLYAGTALGAVRHHGFIPWDDDIDLVMTREDLNRFLKIWKSEEPEGYYYETCLTDQNCGICHTKVRKNGTIFLSKGENGLVGHHGIWVDIFPLDKVKKGINTAEVYEKGVILNLLTRANENVLDDTEFKKITRALLRMIPYPVRKKIIQHTWRWLIENSKRIDNNYKWMTVSALYEFSLRFPQNMVENYIEISFEGKKFLIYKDYDIMLRAMYGDYMVLPPKEKQVCIHNPVIVKF